MGGGYQDFLVSYSEIVNALRNHTCTVKLTSVRKLSLIEKKVLPIAYSYVCLFFTAFPVSFDLWAIPSGMSLFTASKTSSSCELLFYSVLPPLF